MTNQTHFRVSRARSKVDSTGLCSDEGGTSFNLHFVPLDFLIYILRAKIKYLTESRYRVCPIYTREPHQPHKIVLQRQRLENELLSMATFGRAVHNGSDQPPSLRMKVATG